METWVVTLGILLWIGAARILHVSGQEEFTGAITCYECYDKVENTTCGNPVMPNGAEHLGTIDCKRGACIKWTFYRNSVLMIRRTCSEKVNMHIALSAVCRTERNGNGYLCMCSRDQCNSALRTVGMTSTLLVSIGVVLSHLTVTGSS